MERFFWYFVTIAGLALGGCGGGAPEISNDRLIESFEQGRTGIWVSAQAPVLEPLGDQEIAGTLNQRFTLRINDQMTVQVRHSVDDSERVPVAPGDLVSVQGYYQWDARGGFISNTHRDPEQPGGGGWVEHKGTRYE